ncbi:MAG: hypothetical protein AB7K08_02420 [Microbacteriaceae bacterium]
MTVPGTRRRRAQALFAALLSTGIALLSAPQTAQAAYTQYALNYPLTEVAMKYSAAATVSGGKAYLSVSNLPRLYLQTMSGSVLLASTYADNQATALMSHPPYAGARSRVYWDFLGGTLPGSPTIDVNAWRK